MTITYQVKNAVYVNLTNRCPCNCTFCLRHNGPGVFGSGPLWLEREPTLEETIDSLGQWDYERFREVVFCGYGEPTERLETILETAPRIRSELKKTVRLDTNGLGNLINGRDIVPDLAQAVDSISISLNAPDAESYKKITRCRFDAQEAYDSLMDFIRECKEKIGAVTVSIVGGYQPPEDEEKCRLIAEELGVRFRVR